MLFREIVARDVGVAGAVEGGAVQTPSEKNVLCVAISNRHDHWSVQMELQAEIERRQQLQECVFARCADLLVAHARLL